MCRFEAAWQKKDGGRRARSVDQRLVKLVDRLKEKQWTRHSIMSADHPPLNIHWLGLGLTAPPSILVDNTTKFAVPTTIIPNSSLSTLMTSIYPSKFQP
jgi:hypothetical protein